jgi:hypothetical protein
VDWAAVAKKEVGTMTPAAILAAAPAERITLTQLARQENVAPSTCWRWATKGIRGLQLPSVLIGGSKRATTRAAFEAWCLQLTATANKRSVPTEAAAELVNDEESRAARAEAKLACLGLS